MKNILSIAFSLLILVSGCSQEEFVRNQDQPSDCKIFTASFEQNESRTYIEEGNLLRWTAGDQISLFDGNALNRQYQFDGKTGDNGGTFSLVDKPFGTGNDLNSHYAVYPYDKDITIKETGVITATMPAEQSYAENSFGLGANTMVAVTKNTDDTFLKFKNVGGYLKLQLYGDNVTIKSITLTGNNNEKLAGKATIIPVYNQNPIISMADDATKSITLNCGDGVIIASTAEAATTFWFVVPPTTFANGFEVTITDAQGNVITQSTSYEISVERNVIKPMEAFEVKKENVTTIPNYQIWYSTSDDNIFTPSGNFGAQIVSNSYNDGKGVITFSSDVTKIESYAFSNSNLTSITLPNSITTIKSYAFGGCSSLTNIKIPNSVTTIGDHAFESCSSLTSITIPNSVTTIGERAFGYCSSLTNIIIPKNVVNIGNKLFTACNSLTSIIVEDGNAIYDSRENCNAIIETETNTLISGCKSTIIPNTVTTIGKYAFLDCSSLKSITIPNSVTTIGAAAFYYCTSLESLTIPNSVKTIGSQAFESCSSLTSVTIPNNVKTIERLSFAQCTSLANVTIPNGVTTIGEDAFSGCSSLINITIPNSVTAIEKRAFFSTSLANVTIPNNVTTIGERAFGHCSYLTSITIPNSVTTIGSYAFSNCNSLKNITIPNSITVIENYTFESCNSLTDITIPNTVTTIGMGAFSYCSDLTSIILPNSLTTIGKEAFRDCSLLTSITIPSNVETIGDVAFSGCSSLTEVNIQATNPPILGTEPFMRCSNRLVIYVPENSLATYKASESWNKLNISSNN